MKNTIVLIILPLFLSLNMLAQKADDIIGKYSLPNKIDVEIYKRGDKFYGKIINLHNFENGQTLDIHNPDKSKRNNPIVGMEVIKDLEYNADEKQWINGSMYGAEKGLVFDLEVTEYRKNEIVVVGSKFIFWKTLVWKRI